MQTCHIYAARAHIQCPPDTLDEQAGESGFALLDVLAKPNPNFHLTITIHIVTLSVMQCCHGGNWDG